MTRHHSLTDAAVRSAAVAAASRTGTTTTLDVKLRLRQSGYWATQTDVSRRLRRVAARGRWPWWPVGPARRPFRLYGVPVEGARGADVAARAAFVN